MKEEQFFEETREGNKASLSMHDIIDQYLQYWKWFVLSVLICLSFSFLYIRYSKPDYISKAMVLIKTDNEGSVNSEMSLFQDLGVLDGGGGITGEIEIFKSRTLLADVAKELNLTTVITFDSRTGLRTIERYHNPPFKVEIKNIDTSILYEQESHLGIKMLSGSKFEVLSLEGKSYGKFGFNETISTKSGDLKLLKTKYFKATDENEVFHLHLLKLDQVVLEIQNNLSVTNLNDDDIILEILMHGSSIERNNDIINELIRQHKIAAIRDKNEIASNTSEFINDRIKFITEELSIVDEEGKTFKTKYNLVDVNSDAALFLEQKSETEKLIIEKNIQLEIGEFLNKYLKTLSSLDELLPSNLGLDDNSIATNIVEYNNLVLARKRLLLTAGKRNPSVLKIEGQLNSIRSSLDVSLLNAKNTLLLELNILKRKEQLYISKIGAVPEYEREFREIKRQQQIKETLYLYLLQKREENEIKLAATVGNAKIIDSAYSDGIPVSPKKKIIYLASVLLGLIIPFGVLYILNLFNNKIHSEKDIENAGLPCLGYIPFNSEKDQIVSFQGARSPISEAFRMLRTNMNFMLNNEKEGAKVIFVTSTQAGEGKTFVSLNLAHTIAQTDKKVVLIGLDLRAPKILEYVNLPHNIGVTNYLIDPKMEVSSVLQPSQRAKTLSYITSGVIPPNPSELMNKPRLANLFKKLESEFDYIVVDTAPVGAVVDTLMLTHLSDLVVYIARANVLDKRSLNVPVRLHKENKLGSMAVLVNGIKNSGRSYGYGYGYGADFTQKKKWFRKGK